MKATGTEMRRTIAKAVHCKWIRLAKRSSQMLIAYQIKGTERTLAMRTNLRKLPAYSAGIRLAEAPGTLRIPISRARFNALAVDKLMKLAQAISRIKKAMEERIYLFVILPLFPTSSLYMECSCTSYSGCRKRITVIPKFLYL